MPRRLAPMVASLVASWLAQGAPPAGAGEVEARYVVYGGGLPVLEVEAAVELRPDRYRLQTLLRTRGLAELLLPGQTLARTEGSWRDREPRPAIHRSDGLWRGRPSRIELAYVGGDPVLRLLQPAEPEERDPVPDDLRRGTLDALSAVARLARTVAETGRCDGAAAVFDGRRRTEIVMRTLGRDLLPAWRRDAWSGEALRCGYESRLVAGFRRDQDPAEAARPLRGTAWIAAVHPGAPPLPVRVDIPSRWFGTVTGILLRAADAGPAALSREARQ